MKPMSEVATNKSDMNLPDDGKPLRQKLVTRRYVLVTAVMGCFCLASLVTLLYVVAQYRNCLSDIGGGGVNQHREQHQSTPVPMKYTHEGIHAMENENKDVDETDSEYSTEMVRGNFESDPSNGTLVTLTDYELKALQLAESSDCDTVLDVLLRLRIEIDVVDAVTYENILQFREYLFGRASEIQCNIEVSAELFTKTVAPARRFERSPAYVYCRESWIGDGWCNRACNTEEYALDGGDCCLSTCYTGDNPDKCGMLGYDCKMPVPSWFVDHVQLCYEWYPDADAGQCGGGANRLLCANINEYTDYYKDETDDRPGGCRMRWGITAPLYDHWFQQVQVCYKWYADGTGKSQCGGGVRSQVCASINNYTPYYQDDTDGRYGGCRMSWQLKVPPNSPDWIYGVEFCFRWYATSNGDQCGGGVDREVCANTNMWTPYYLDDTDNRRGGCRMKWGIFLPHEEPVFQ